MGPCPLRLPTKVQSFCRVCLSFSVWNLGSGHLSLPQHIYVVKKSTISEWSDQGMIWDSSMVLILSRPFTVCLCSESLTVSTRIYRLDREDLFISQQMEKQIGVAHAVYVNYCLNPIMQYLKIAGVITTAAHITTKIRSDQGFAHAHQLHPGDIMRRLGLLGLLSDLIYVPVEKAEVVFTMHDRVMWSCLTARPCIKYSRDEK